MIDNFKAYVVREGKNGVFSGQIETKKFDDLPPNEITIKHKIPKTIKILSNPSQ